MDASERRHRRERVIRRRVAFVRNVLGAEPRGGPGAFAKRKALDCSCPTCQAPTKAPPFRGKERQAVRCLLAIEEER